MAKDTNDAIKIDDVEYKVDELSDHAKYLLEHLGDLDRKIRSAKFTLDQLHVNRDAFSIMLKDEVQKKKSSEEPTEN